MMNERLTPDEIQALRQDARLASELIEKKLQELAPQTPTNPLSSSAGTATGASAVTGWEEMSLQEIEELQLCTMYSDVETWTRMLEYQYRRHGSEKPRFRGPPGLWEEICARLSSSTEPGTTSPPST